MSDDVSQEIEAYGAGPSLDENFDIDPSRGGDVSISRGVDRLSDDIAQYVEPPASALEGDLISREDEFDVKSEIRHILRQDSRINSVESITVTTDDDGYVIEVELNTVLGLYKEQISG